jgi:hypothetical protein
MMRIRTLWLWLPCLAAAYCHDCPENDPVRRWLTCIECNDGELDAVQAIAVRHRARLRTILTDKLLAGPSDALRDSLMVRFAANYDLLHTTPDTAERSAYARFALKRFVSKWRVRAAIALAGVGNAQAALDSAAHGNFRNAADSLFEGEDQILLAVRDTLSRHPWRAVVE